MFGVRYSQPDSYPMERKFNKTQNLIFESAAEPHFQKLKIQF
jgi:hypothetical protein